MFQIAKFFKIHAGLLALFIFSFSSSFALTQQEIAFLAELKERDLGEPALWGLSISEKEAKNNKFYGALRTQLKQAEVEYEALREKLKEHCFLLDQLTMALIMSDFGYPGYLFREEGVKTTCYLESRERLSMTIRYKDLIEHQLVTEDDDNPPVDQVFFRFLSDPLALSEYLRYFEYDVLILSRFFDDTSQLPSFDVLRKALTKFASKAPFLVLSIPKTCIMKGASAFLDDPSSLFMTPNQIKITELKLPKDHPRRVLFVQKVGISIQSHTYIGTPLKYKPKFGRFIWVNPEVYVKQYQQKAGIFYNLIKCSRTLDFYERANTHKLKFVPKLLFSVINEDFGFLVIKNEGLLLKDYLEDKSEDLTKKTINTLLDCFVTLEELGINPCDLKVENIVVNAKGQVFLIDYDNAKVTQPPTLPEFLCILWGLANGKSKGRYTSRTFVADYKKYPLEEYGPLLKSYVDPILQGKVATFKELKVLLEKK